MFCFRKEDFFFLELLVFFEYEGDGSFVFCGRWVGSVFRVRFYCNDGINSSSVERLLF